MARTAATTTNHPLSSPLPNKKLKWEDRGGESLGMLTWWEVGQSP